MDSSAGLGTLIEKLGDLAERGEELHRLGELSGKPVHGVVGFTIKTALGDGNGVKVEPFGNVGKDQRTGKVAVHEVTEPMVDVFEEAGTCARGRRDAGHRRGLTSTSSLTTTS